MIKAMILDKEKIAADMLIKMLETYNEIEVTGCYTDAKSALEALEIEQPDVLFVDIDVSESKNLELIKRILNSAPDLNVVVLSYNTEYALESFELGITDYIVKPLNENRLQLTFKKMALDVGFQNRNHDLSIKSFGSFHLVANGDHIVKWRTKKVKELFAYLWINSEVSVNRDTLISKLFPNINEKKANTLLSTTLYQMRQVLQEYTNEEVIKYLNNGYRFKLKIPSDYDVVLNIIESNEFTEENYRILRKLLKGEFLEEENYAWSDRIATQTILSTKHYLKAYLNNIECDNLLIEDILLFMFDLDAKDETVIGNILSFYKENESYSKYADFSTKCLKLKGNGILKPQVSNTAL